MFVRNCWYVAAWSHEVGPEALFARTLLNQPMVFYRLANGDIVAMDDRCSHRGAPLSQGRREGDHLRCLYHGLKFDCSGQCVEAPAQEAVSPRMKVRSYPVVERDKWIWIWPGDAALADPSLIPPTPVLTDPAWRYLPGYKNFPAKYLLIADNLLDLSHLPFLHPTTLGGSSDYAKVIPTTERLENGVRSSKWVFGTEPPAYTREYGNFGANAKVDRWMLYDYLVPSILLMDAGMAAAGSGAEKGDRTGALQTRSYQALTPETPTSTHYFFMQAHNFQIDKPEVTQGMFNALRTAFDEDDRMIAGQQRNLQMDPSFQMVGLSVDSALVHFRRVIDKRLRVEAQVQALRITPVPIATPVSSLDAAASLS
jgi:vanillate O-demethylase monooxygenase subunit